MSKKILSLVFIIFIVFNFATNYRSIQNGINIFSSSTEVLKYRKIGRTTYNYIKEVAEYIKKNNLYK